MIDYTRYPLTPLNLSNGGARRDRTDDPLLAKQVLSQLSYGPLLDRTKTSTHIKAPPKKNSNTGR